MDGTGLRFETMEHGGEYPYTMPQAIKLIDAEERSAIHVPTNNSVNGCADLSFARWLACFRCHDDGASVGVMIVGDRSPPDAVTWHSSIK